MVHGSIQLSNSKLALELDNLGHILTIHNPQFLGRIFQFSDALALPVLDWQIRWQDGKPVNLPQEFQREWQSEHAVHFSKDTGWIFLSIRVNLDGALCYYTSRLGNHSDRTLSEFEYCLNIPPSYRDELFCTIPYCAGRKIALSKLEQELLLQYPAQGSMQWVSVYSADQGIYLGVHDELPLYKELSIGITGEVASICWRFLDLALEPGETVDLPPLIISLPEGDWRSGARIYQGWARKYVDSPSPPAWYRERPAWAWVGLKGQHANLPWNSTADLPVLSQLAWKAGIPAIQMTAYTENGHDTLYPDYRPGISLGGDAGLSDAIDKIHRDGRYFNIYVNGRVVDPASSLPVEQRAAWAVRPAKGAPPLREQYGTVNFDVMCPGASQWRELFCSKLCELVRQFDIDGIYIDQVCGCKSYPCYANNHDHLKPNLAWSNYRHFIVDIREALQEYKPGVILATEGVNDLLGQHFDSMQAHNDWSGPGRDLSEPLDDLYRVTFPEHLLNFGCITADPGTIELLKRAHVSGAGFDFGVFDWRKAPVELVEAARMVIEWYKKHRSVFQSSPGQPLIHFPVGIKALTFFSAEKIIINSAWFGPSDPAMVPKKVDYTLPYPMERRIQSVAYYPLRTQLPEFQILTNQRWVISTAFAEISGIEIVFGKD